MPRVYDTQQWKRVRAMKLSMDPLCEECRRIGRMVAATQVDHRVALARGGAAFDLENLVALCASCHSRKTASMDGAFGNQRKERARVRGCDVHGRPLDPDHEWNRASNAPALQGVTHQRYGGAAENHDAERADDRAPSSAQGSAGNAKGGRSWV